MSAKFWKYQITPELGDQLVDALASDLEIPSYLCNWLLFLPLPYDSINIPIR